MRKNYLLIFILLLFGTAFAEVKIVFIANNKPVTNYDVAQRIKIIDIFSDKKNPPSPDYTKKITEDMLNETLVIDALLKNWQIRISKEQKDSALQNIMQSRKSLTVEEVRKKVKEENISDKDLESFLEAQVALNILTESVLAQRINVSNKDIDQIIASFDVNADQQLYNLYELFIPYENNDGKIKAEQLAKDLYKQANSLTKFEELARKYSESPSSANGGNIGWVPINSFDSSIRDALKNTRKNGITYPIAQDNGYIMYFVGDVNVVPSNPTDPTAKEDQRNYIARNIKNSKLAAEYSKYITDLRARSIIFYYK